MATNTVKSTHTLDGQKYELDNKDLVAASAATQAVNTATVTQGTNQTTAVTINAYAGVISTHATAFNATTNAEFTVNNNKVQADSVVLVTMQDNNTTNNKQLACAIHSVAAGSFVVTIVNPHSATATSATACAVHFLVVNNDG